MRPLEQTGYAIRNILKNDSAVTAIVGDKIRPIVAGRSDVAPYIIYNCSGTPVQSKDGNDTLAQVICTVEMFHTDPTALVDLCNKVRSALDNRQGIFNNVDVRELRFDDEQGNYAESAELEGVYTHQHDYMLWVNASTVPVNQMVTTITVKDSSGTTIQTTELPTGGAGIVTIPDSVVTVKNTAGDSLGSTNVKATAPAEIIAPDAYIDLNDDDFFSAKSGYPANIELVNQNEVPIIPISVVGKKIKVDVPKDIQGKFAFTEGSDISQMTITSFEAGLYTTFTQDGSSGTITIKVNNGSFGSLPASITFAIGQTIYFKRTSTGADGWIVAGGVYE